MKNPYLTDEFKRLQAHWYRKLRESGFEDIEDEKYPMGRFMAGDWQSRRFGLENRPTEINREGDGDRHYDLVDLRFEYYTMATEFLWRHEFTEHLHQRIWAFHAHGFSLREIGRLVGKDKDHVHAVVRALKTLMLGREVLSMRALRRAK